MYTNKMPWDEQGNINPDVKITSEYNGVKTLIQPKCMADFIGHILAPSRTTSAINSRHYQEYKKSIVEDIIGKIVRSYVTKKPLKMSEEEMAFSIFDLDSITNSLDPQNLLFTDYYSKKTKISKENFLDFLQDYLKSSVIDKTHLEEIYCKCNKEHYKADYEIDQLSNLDSMGQTVELD